MTLTFPHVTGSDLNGQTVKVPTDLKGQLNIVVIAFIRGQGAQIAPWVPSLTSLVTTHPNVAWYELPTLSAAYLSNRPYIDGGMRAAIRDADSRERTITLYLDKEEFKRTLDIPTEETIHLFLIEKDGQVLWRADDGFTKTKIDELTETINKNL